MKYKVNEIFYSIQAEGKNTGRPAVFIRLCGCNLKCTWCDTKNHTEGVFMTKEEIETRVKELVGNKKPLIVFTGGEPTLQLKDDEQLLKGYPTAIETNGTNKVADWIEWITCSPKSDIDFSAIGREPDEIKVVFEKGRYKYLESLKNKNCLLFIQPLELNGSMNITDTVEFIKNNPEYRLSLQFHKMIGMR